MYEQFLRLNLAAAFVEKAEPINEEFLSAIILDLGNWPLQIAPGDVERRERGERNTCPVPAWAVGTAPSDLHPRPSAGDRSRDRPAWGFKTVDRFKHQVVADTATLVSAFYRWKTQSEEGKADWVALCPRVAGRGNCGGGRLRPGPASSREQEVQSAHPLHFRGRSRSSPAPRLRAGWEGLPRPCDHCSGKLLSDTHAAGGPTHLALTTAPRNKCFFYLSLWQFSDFQPSKTLTGFKWGLQHRGSNQATDWHETQFLLTAWRCTKGGSVRAALMHPEDSESMLWWGWRSPPWLMFSSSQGHLISQTHAWSSQAGAAAGASPWGPHPRPRPWPRPLPWHPGTVGWAEVSPPYSSHYFLLLLHPWLSSVLYVTDKQPLNHLWVILFFFGDFSWRRILSGNKRVYVFVIEVQASYGWLWLQQSAEVGANFPWPYGRVILYWAL